MSQGITPYVPNMNPSPPVAAPAGYGTTPAYLGQAAPAYNAASTSGGPSILGTGTYTGAPIQIDQNAFNNPVGTQAGQQLSGELGSYLGNTTGGVTAPTGPEASLAAQYAQLAAGQGPSAATIAAQQAGAQNLAATESALGSARGAGNPAQAQQLARNAQAAGQQQVAQNVVQGKTQEELAALGAEGGLQTNIANQGLQAAQGNQSNNLAANNAYLQALSGINNQQQQGQIAGQQLAANTALGQQNIANNAYQAAAGNNQKLAGGVLQAAQGAASLFGL